MKILIACEESGTVREAFRAIGHDAWSADLLQSRLPGQHICGDVVPHLKNDWDLIIAHPPCTFLCNSGVRWLAPGGVINADRHQKMMMACDFFAALYFAPCQHIVIENPVMHKYARDYLTSTWKIPTYSQTVQPWQFGEGETKLTCFWIRGLPLLKPTNIVTGRIARIHRMAPGPDRAKERSKTYQGIADAMAAQWGTI